MEFIVYLTIISGVMAFVMTVVATMFVGPTYVVHRRLSMATALTCAATAFVGLAALPLTPAM